jgi:hypothetical protein
MSARKPKSELDNDLDEALKETFPGSDPIAVDATPDKPLRPVDRRPPALDKGAINRLAQKAKERLKR